MNKGFIKLNRDITEWQWYKEPLTAMLYIHLAITANWCDNSFKGVSVKRGERVASYDALSAETGLSVKNIRTALSRLIRTGEVAKRQEGKCTVISVSNYDSFQIGGSEMASERQRCGSETATDKEYKEYKELKEREEEEEKADSKTFNKESSSSVSDVVNLYCELCKSLPPPDLSPETEANIRRAINFHGIEKIKSAFSTVETTPFLRGDIKNWCADINWIFAGTNIDKILSGKYREYRERNSRSREVSDSYGIANLEEYKEFINNF